MIQSGTFVVAGVEVVDFANLQFLVGIHERFRDRARSLLVRNLQRTAVAVSVVCAVHVVLGLFEVGQNVVPAPAFTALFGPAVIVFLLAANIKHRVDRRRAAQCAPTWLIAQTSVQAWLWHCFESPVVDLAKARQHRNHAHWGTY